MAVNINIKYTNAAVHAYKQPFTLFPGETNTTTTSLTFVGQGTAGYSTAISENMLHLLENFASPVAPKNPTVGQLWYDSSVKELKVLQNITSSGVNAVHTWASVSQSLVISATPPAEHKFLWYDTSDALHTNHQLKIYNSVGGWQPVAKQWVVTGAAAPANTTQLWFNTSNAAAAKHELYAYNNVTLNWAPVVSHDASLLSGNIDSARLTTSNIGGNAATASSAATSVKLTTARTFSITGGATATSVLFNGEADVVLNVTGLNAGSLTTGTVSSSRLGASGNRAAGNYLAGDNTWTPIPYIPDSYTKTESNAQLAAKVARDSITHAGFASNNTTLPYFQRESDSTKYYLQPRLGYTPAPAATTLDGYGITDAYTKSQVNALIPPAAPTTGNLAATGWTRLPNGLTLQWGVGPAITDDMATTVALPVPGTILNVQVTGIGVYSNSVGPCWLTDSWTTASFRVSNNYNNGPWRPFSWLVLSITN